MKLVMLWDMEGVSGLFTREQVWFWEDGVRPEAEAQGKRLLTEDACSAARAALAAGADQVVVVDTHHGGRNMDPAAFGEDPRVAYRAAAAVDEGGHRRWLADLDQRVDGFLLMAHHARAGTRGAFLPHTWTGEWLDFRINGASVGELAIEACYAGHFGVPTVLAHGDAAACAEAEATFPGIVTAPVKRALGPTRAAGLQAEEGHRLVAERIAAAVAALRRQAVAPYQPTLPMTVAVDLRREETAEALAARPGIRRSAARTVEVALRRRCDVVEWILGVGLDPGWQG
jgi:D-amino peptidase